MVVEGNKLKTIAKAPSLKPVPLDIDFAMSIFRKAFEHIKKLEDKAYTRGYNEGAKKGPEQFRGKIEKLEADVREYEQILNTFYENTGIHLSRWEYKGISAAIKTLLNYRQSPIQQIESIKNMAESFLGTINDEIKLMKNFPLLTDQLKANLKQNV